MYIDTWVLIVVGIILVVLITTLVNIVVFRKIRNKEQGIQKQDNIKANDDKYDRTKSEVEDNPTSNILDKQATVNAQGNSDIADEQEKTLEKVICGYPVYVTEISNNIISNDIDSPILKKELLIGLGGWLIWFQIRIYLGLLNSFPLLVNPYVRTEYKVFTFVVIGLLILTLVFFYLKRITFRTTYILAGVTVLIMNLIIPNYPSVVAFLVVETCFIIALFRSERVEYTFK